MKFKAHSNKVVRLHSGLLATFPKGEYETSNKDDIKSLQNAKGVTEVKAVRASKKED